MLLLFVILGCILISLCYCESFCFSIHVAYCLVPITFNYELNYYLFFNTIIEIIISYQFQYTAACVFHVERWESFMLRLVCVLI